MRHEEDVVELFRPVGSEELDLIRLAGWRRFPPRLVGQPIFYPVLTFEYAEKIARDWNMGSSGFGAVTAFRVRRSFIGLYEIHEVGGSSHREYWIPAEELDKLNANIV